MSLEEHPFVTRLERLRKDRGALAKLRRGLGKPFGTPDMYPYVVPFLSDSRREQKAHFLIASLFALHPQPAAKGTSMGDVFRKMKGTGSESIEKRFLNLLAADVEDVGRHLRHAVSLAKSKEIGIDYHRLLRDLRYWGYESCFVQRGWAQDYWGRKDSVDELPTEGR